jgi:hypothetical protein
MPNRMPKNVLMSKLVSGSIKMLNEKPSGDFCITCEGRVSSGKGIEPKRYGDMMPVAISRNVTHRIEEPYHISHFDIDCEAHEDHHILDDHNSHDQG